MKLRKVLLIIIILVCVLILFVFVSNILFNNKIDEKNIQELASIILFNLNRCA